MKMPLEKQMYQTFLIYYGEKKISSHEEENKSGKQVKLTLLV